MEWNNLRFDSGMSVVGDHTRSARSASSSGFRIDSGCNSGQTA